MTAIFLGNGEQSKLAVRQLHSKLDAALDHLGGLQQPVHWDHEPSADEERREIEDNAQARKVIREIAIEIVRALGEDDLLVDELTNLVMVPGTHNPDYQFDVRVQLDHQPTEGWTVVRDDANGGGPWRRGPKGATPSEAVRAFREMVEKKRPTSR